jgi:hypothetical protein
MYHYEELDDGISCILVLFVDAISFDASRFASGGKSSGTTHR